MRAMCFGFPLPCFGHTQVSAHFLGEQTGDVHHTAISDLPRAAHMCAEIPISNSPPSLVFIAPLLWKYQGAVHNLH
jgi:hypothetical protein